MMRVTRSPRKACSMDNENPVRLILFAEDIPVAFAFTPNPEAAWLLRAGWSMVNKETFDMLLSDFSKTHPFDQAKEPTYDPDVVAWWKEQFTEVGIKGVRVVTLLDDNTTAFVQLPFGRWYWAGNLQLAHRITYVMDRASFSVFRTSKENIRATNTSKETGRGTP